MRIATTIVCLGLLNFGGAAAALAAGDYPTFLSPAAAGPDYQIQGEYRGPLSLDGGEKRHGAQVIALGDGAFRVELFTGGLPGAGWKRGQKQQSATTEAPAEDGKATLVGESFKATIDAATKTMTVYNSGGEKLGELKHVVRRSPTLAAEPPEGAVVLFDGQHKDNFLGGKLTQTGLLLVGAPQPAKPADQAQPAQPGKPARQRPPRENIYTKDKFGSFTLHLEFRTPYMPTATGQARGNSGVYLQDRYEVQVLDSFGLEGLDNECGGLYKMQQPAVNMCLPPLQWQTYDIDFTAPAFDAEGKKTANARVTIRHNGVTIYDDVELPSVTPGGDPNEGPTGPIKLQDHGNPVAYRNIWLVPRKN